MEPERTSKELLSLDGEWKLSLDPHGVGDGPSWAAEHVERTAVLPGSLDAQGIGESVSVDTDWTGTIFDRSFYDSPKYERYREDGNVKVPFFLQPQSRFVGAAWYRKRMRISSAWEGRPVSLFLERPHWGTELWLDDRKLGGRESLSTPHCYDLGQLEVDRDYWITLRVDNRVRVAVGENAHSVSDHTQGNWNGVVGSLHLFASPLVGFRELRVLSTTAKGGLRVCGRFEGDFAGSKAELRVYPKSGSSELPVLRHELLEAELDGKGNFNLPFTVEGKIRCWDEFSPELYVLEAVVGDVREKLEFGFRDFSVEGTQFAINGRRLLLRGVLDCCIFPATGHPPMDVESWSGVLSRIKECGFNHVRFHSWCPPEAAFVAADRLGVYLQVECAVWPNAEAVLGFNSPLGIGDGESVDDWAIREGELILATYGHHPSFVMMACGNEPGGARHREYLAEWTEHFKNIDPYRLYTGCAGWPEIDENEFHVVPNPRIHQWGDGLGCRLNGLPPSTLHDYEEFVASHDCPIVSHEIGQWCAFPEIESRQRFTGHLQPTSYDIIADGLAANGMSKLSGPFHYASGKLQTLCYKEEIESSLRTLGLAGFQLLGLQDFPGQGTAPVGMLDAFWEEKPYCKVDEIRRFCNSTVVLARLAKRVFGQSEPFVAELEVAHYGGTELRGEEVHWSLVEEDGRVLKEACFSVATVPVGLVGLGRVVADFSGVSTPSKLRLVVRLSVDGTFVENDWDIWVYSDAVDRESQPSLTTVSNFHDAKPLLERGEKVLLASSRVSNEIKLGFTPIFWNTACTQGQAPHTLGISCDPRHRALDLFPSDCFSNWQWWYLLRGSSALLLDDLPTGVEPIVRVVDDWYENRRLAFLIEARVGKGMLLICSADLLAVAESEGEALVRGQFLESLRAYVASESFCPQAELSFGEIEGLFEL